MKKFSILLLVFVLTATLLFGGCQKNEPAVPAPSWETESVEENGFSYEIPKGWIRTEDPTNQGSIVYVPADANLQEGTSNVNLVIWETGAKAVAFDDLKAALENDLPQQLFANGFSALTDLRTWQIDAAVGTVCAVSYKAEVNGATFTQMQYYPLVDHYTLVITATDIGDGITPHVDEVAEYILLSMQKDA